MTGPQPKPLNLLFPLRVWLVVLFFVLPASLLVIVLPGQERRRRTARLAGRFLFRVAGVRLKVEGLHHLPQSCIVVANHASYLDGVILTAALPPRFSFVIKREITAAPLVGRLLARLGSEFVERFDKKGAHSDASRLIKRARSGACLGVFPEGTFKRDPGLRPFHLGAFLTATRAGLPVAPVVIRGARAILPAGTWTPRHGHLEVEVLPAVIPRGRLGEHARDLRHTVRNHILKHCGEPDAAESHPPQHAEQ
ncbi:MAG TPA: lysophospholipid acyltransferase family protein [Gammaproteobacteria bacterium]|nr:lysophospholipid acyltransferase family protein [Gammaproteobacteria bacterium]